VADRDVLLVFVKHPQPGAAKTRLIPTLGPENAADLYRVLAEEEIRGTRPQGDEYRRLFFFAPEEASAEVEGWLPGERLLPQLGADLGARMSAAFAAAFAGGARRAAIVGTDVPWVSREVVLVAFAALDGHDVVLGPAQDGGYYLMALSRHRPALFEGIAWSTPGVLAATAERAGALGLSVSLLEPLRDIDTIEDLRAEWPRLRPLFEKRKDLLVAVETALGG
jgi:rSAM/selenodomain-associated transferase 1